jgi:hypothetical protein
VEPPLSTPTLHPRDSLSKASRVALSQRFPCPLAISHP